MEGSTLHIADSEAGLVIVDISHSQGPSELARYPTPEAVGVDANETFAYLLDRREGMIVLDVSDPSRPIQFANFPMEQTTSVVVRDHYAYVTNSSGFQVVHILIQGRSFPIAACNTGGKAYALAVDDARAYVVGHAGGVHVLDISEPSQLSDDSVLGSCSSDYAAGIAVAGSVAFVAKGKRGPVTLIWHSGTMKIPRAKELEPDRKGIDTGAYVYGDKGVIMYGSHGAGGVRIIPETTMKAYKYPEKKIPRVRGHHDDWLRAIRGGRKAGSDFSYGGPLTEIAMLGVIALKMPGTKLEWDAQAMKFTSCPEANTFVNPPYRKGWML